MADLDTLRAEAAALRDELHAHDLARDEIGARKIAKDAELYAAEHLDGLERQAAAIAAQIEQIDAHIAAPTAAISASAPTPEG